MMVRGTFLINGKKSVYLFSDDYKFWELQVKEFLHYNKVSEILKFEKATNKMGCYGLSWCIEQDYQEELNKEGKGRIYSKFIFREMSIDKRTLLQFKKMLHIENNENQF